MREFLTTSNNNQPVYVDVEKTNLALHIVENPDLLTYIKEAIEQREVIGKKVALEVDLGRTIGTTSMVEVSDEDEVVYAKRIGRERYSKFVKNRDLVPTSWVVAILFKDQDCYLVWSGWCGRLLPQEPDGSGGTRTSREFDQTHAMVYDPNIIQMDTLCTYPPGYDVDKK